MLYKEQTKNIPITSSINSFELLIWDATTTLTKSFSNY